MKPTVKCNNFYGYFYFLLHCNVLLITWSTFGTDSRNIRSRSNSSRRITCGGGNEKGTTLNQPSSQQKIPNINHSNGKQRPHTADLHVVGRSRATSKSMKITSTNQLSASSAAKSKQSPSDAKHHLQRMYSSLFIFNVIYN